MNSEMFAILPPTQLFFKCAVPAVAGLASGILTLGLVKTLKLKVPRTMLPESSP